MSLLTTNKKLTNAKLLENKKSRLIDKITEELYSFLVDKNKNKNAILIILDPVITNSKLKRENISDQLTVTTIKLNDQI